MIIQIGTEVDESRILWKHKESDEWEGADIDDLIRAYENRPRGEWIASYFNEWCGTDENHNSVFRKTPCVKCSQCGEKRRNEEEFCPNCGAYMRSEEND